MKAKFFFSTFLFFIALLTQAQERISFTINSNWLFIKGDTTKKTSGSNWMSVSVPHTWNGQDVMGDEPGYYRGEGWYKKTLYVPANWKEKVVYLFFEGANQVTHVFV